MGFSRKGLGYYRVHKINLQSHAICPPRTVTNLMRIANIVASDLVPSLRFCHGRARVFRNKTVSLYLCSLRSIIHLSLPQPPRRRMSDRHSRRSTDIVVQQRPFMGYTYMCPRGNHPISDPTLQTTLQYIYNKLVIDRKGQNFGFGRNLDTKILPKHFGRKPKGTERVISAERGYFGRNIHLLVVNFGRNRVPKETVSAEIDPFGRNCSFGPFRRSAEIAVFRISSFGFGRNS